MESMLHKRYKIGERLFSNSLGELFLGRDLQATTTQRLLIHYLPAQLLSDSALKQSLGTLQSLGNQAHTSVLQVLDCAWSDTEVFFVLEAPEAWSLSVLPVAQGQPTNVHQKALTITQELINQGLITKGIEPSLFLVAPTGELYLLGTAFLTELQNLTLELPTLLQPPPPLPPAKKHSFLPLILLGVTGLVAAGSLGVYQFAHPSKQVQAPVAQQLAVLDKPLTPSLATTRVEPRKTAAQTDLEQASLELHTPVANTPLSKTSEPALATPTIELKPIHPIATQHLERATEAIKHGHLHTGLYYLRLAKKLEANPEQLQASAKRLLEQAQLTDAASEVLGTQIQTRIKQEFSLE